MRKEIALSALGLVFLAFFLGIFLGVVLVLEDFLGISEGAYVSKEPVLVVIYLSLIAMICGAIGGYLIGRYIHRALASASRRTT